ncbi:MAG: hypothetical protein EP344_04905 [Bacteroidetes bacterium]|nr:MAG: hypothetical protein EP344_04905 [Bacteroidota bacterium]
MISHSFPLSEAVVHALGWTLVHSLWQGSAVALVLWLVLPRLKQANQRYWVSYGALVTVLLAAIGSFAWVYTTPETPAATVEWLLPAAQPDVAISGPALPGDFWQELSARLEPYHPVIVTIWMLGFLFFLVRLAGGLHYMRRLRRQHIQPVAPEWQRKLQDLATRIGCSTPVQLLESALVQSPMALGFFKPLILLPVGMINQISPAEVEAILAHELAHIARRDWLFNLVQAFIETTFYFHPAVWWIAATIRSERENCCDDVAVQLTGNRLVYAKTLVRLQDLARSARMPALALPLEGSTSLLRRRPLLLERIKRILHQPQQSSSLMEKTIAMGILIALITLWTVRANTPPALMDNIREIAEAPLQWFEADPQPEAAYQAVGDTVPQPKKRQRIVREDDDQRVEMEVEDGAIKQLRIDGREINPEEYAQYEELTNEMLRESIPPPPPPVPAPPAPPGGIFDVRVAPAPDAPRPPRSSSSIRVETDDDGNTIIWSERNGKPVEIKVKDGIVWVDDKKVEDGETIEIPGDENNFLFWNDGNRVFRLDGKKLRFGNEDGVFFDVPEPAEAPHFYHFDGDGQHFYFKGNADDMIIEVPEFEFKMDKEAMERAFEEARKNLKLQQQQLEKELRKSELEMKHNRKDLEKAKREQLRAIEEAQRALAETRHVEQETLREAQREYKRAMADAQRAQVQQFRVQSRQNRAESVSGTLKKAMIKDKLITDPENYSFELSKKSLRVNGKKQPSAVHQKYLELYRSQAGKDLGDGKIHVEVRN